MFCQELFCIGIRQTELYHRHIDKSREIFQHKDKKMSREIFQECAESFIGIRQGELYHTHIDMSRENFI